MIIQESARSDDKRESPPPYALVRNRISGLRRRQGARQGLKEFEVHQHVARAVVTDLQSRGCIYQDGHRAYVFLSEDGLLFRIEPDDVHLERLFFRYGLVPTEKIFRYLLSALRLEALRSGERIDVHVLAHYDAGRATLYVHNLGAAIYRITKDSIERIANGTDGILFVTDLDAEPFEIVEDGDQGTDLINELLFQGLRFADDSVRVEDYEWLLTIWLHSLFFPELFPTRPILAFVGPKGSAKTSTLRRIGRAIFGSKFDVMVISRDPRDFDAAVTRDAFVALDNADTRISWLEDRLAVVSTGGLVKRREYYTTNRMVQYPACAALGITSRTPHFRREDVADRLLLMPLQRLREFRPESDQLEEVRRNRNRIMTQLLLGLQKVVTVLALEPAGKNTTCFRMADFATFAIRIAAAEGQGERMSRALSQMAEQQTALTLEDDPTVYLLEVWLKKGGGKNAGREIPSPDLCKELSRLAELEEDIKWFCQNNPLVFGKRLTNIMVSLGERFIVTERHGHARERLLTFWPREGAAGRTDGEEDSADGA